jgi:hypothetical protein
MEFQTNLVPLGIHRGVKNFVFLIQFCVLFILTRNFLFLNTFTSRADNLTQHKKTHDKANHRAKEKALAAEARAPAMSSMTGATKTITATSVAATAAVMA